MRGWVTHEELGQEVCAFVTLCSQATACESDLREFAARTVAAYMVPAQIRIIDEMPVKGAGKIDRDRLKWRAEADIDDL